MLRRPPNIQHVENVCVHGAYPHTRELMSPVPVRLSELSVICPDTGFAEPYAIEFSECTGDNPELECKTTGRAIFHLPRCQIRLGIRKEWQKVPCQSVVSDQ